MNKYKKLALNTIIFGIGTFSSKLLIFLLMPLYTRVLSNSDYGISDLIVNTGNLMIPLVSLGITNAVTRFALDKNEDKRDVFTIGLCTITVGFSMLLLFEPILSHVEFLAAHTWLIYLFVLSATLRAVCQSLVRAKGYVKLYSLDGVLTTLVMVLLTILFLVIMKTGILGYVMAVVLSNAFSVLFLFIMAELRRYVHISCVKRNTVAAMLKYSIPLIPSTIFWWITNVSDRYLVTYFVGSDANGLYAVANKLPTVVVLVAGIFMDAWQMSAVTEDDPGREHFFTNIYSSYQAVVFLAGSGIILLAKPLTKLLVSDSFYSSWQYIPFLAMATIFTCLVTFLGSVYIVEKKSLLTLATIVAGAVLNIVLNLFLIPAFGVNGAAFSTCISYFVVFVLRALNTRKFIRIQWNMPVLIFNIFAVSAQSVIMIMELKGWILYEIILFIALFACNVKPLILNVKKLFG